METMYCPNCGVEHSGDYFCRHCGSALSTDPDEAFMDSDKTISNESQPKKSNVGLGITAGAILILLLLVALSVILSASQNGDSDAAAPTPFEETQAFADSQKVIEQRNQERRLEAIQACEVIANNQSGSLFAPGDENLSNEALTSTLFLVIRSQQNYSDISINPPYLGLAKLESSIRSFIATVDLNIESLTAVRAADLIADIFFTAEKCRELGVQLG